MTEGEYQEWDGEIPPPQCIACSAAIEAPVLLQWTDAFYYCGRCSTKFWFGKYEELFRRKVMAVPAEHFEGNFAVIRKHSESGHSPSRRFKTAKIATAAAVKLAEENFSLTFEVVKIVARVSCLPKATVTRVR